MTRNSRDGWLRLCRLLLNQIHLPPSSEKKQRFIVIIAKCAMRISVCNCFVFIRPLLRALQMITAGSEATSLGSLDRLEFLRKTTVLFFSERVVMVQLWKKKKRPLVGSSSSLDGGAPSWAHMCFAAALEPLRQRLERRVISRSA